MRRREKFRIVPDKLFGLGYNCPIIYGNGKRGNALKHLLIVAGMKIAVTVDLKSPVFSSIEQVPLGVVGDVIIVSVLDSAMIVNNLKNKTELPIYTLEELLNE